MKHRTLAKGDGLTRFKLIVFDWDGTLMDSAAAIVAAIQAGCQDLGIDPPSDEKARHIIGLGLDEALQTVLPELPAARYPALIGRYRHHFLAREKALPLFAGVHEMLAGLTDAGHLLGVATGKSRRGLDRALAESGLGALFQATRCVDECHSKPHPEMLQQLMDEFAATPGDTLMIGDTTHDLLMAKNAGVAALAVAYGAHPRAELMALQPLFCAETVAELRAWLIKHG